MNSNKLRKYTDIVLFFVLCFLLGTGVLIHYRLLPGYRGGHGLTFLGLSRHEWGDHHLWAAYLMIALIIVHIVINFAFVKNIIALKKNWLLILLGLIGLAVFLLFLILPIQHTAGEGHGEGRRGQHEQMQNDSPDEKVHPTHEGGRGEGRGRGRDGQGRGYGRGEGRGRIDLDE